MGFNLVSKGAISAVDPEKQASAKRKQLRDMMRNKEKQWLEHRVRLFKYVDPFVLKLSTKDPDLLLEKSPLSYLDTEIDRTGYLGRMLVTRKLKINMIPIETHQLLMDDRHFDFDPVDLIGGSYHYQREDFQLLSHPNIAWSWNWDSKSCYKGSLGNKIQFCFDSYLSYSKEQMRFYYNDLMGRKMEVAYLEEGKDYFLDRYSLFFKRIDGGFLVRNIEEGYQAFYQTHDDEDIFRLMSIGSKTMFLTLNYDQQGKLYTIQNAYGEEYTVYWQKNGYIEKVEKEGKEVVSYEYDDIGNLTKITQANGGVTQLYYNDFLLVRRMDENKQSFFWQYDKENRVVHTWGPNHSLEGWLEYEPEHLKNRVKNGLGSCTTYEYDVLGFVHRITYGDGSREKFIYDKEDRLIKKVSRENIHTDYAYNALGQKIRENSSNGEFREWQYDEEGKCILYHDKNEYTEYKYDANDLLLEVKRKGIVSERYDYDSTSFLLSRSSLLGEEYEYSYNEKGQLLKKQRKGDGATWLYDSFGRVKSFQDMDQGETYQFHYGENGELSVITSRSQEKVRLEYDGRKQIVSANLDGYRIEWKYDVQGNVIEEKDNSGKLKFVYDKIGSLIHIKENEQSLFWAKRNIRGQITELQVEGLPTFFYKYDDTGRVQQISTDQHELTYKYDEKGNVFEKYINGQFWEFYDFDESGNILRAENNFSELIFTYDEEENIVSEELKISEDTYPRNTKITYQYQEQNESSISLNGRQVYSCDQSQSKPIRNYFLINQNVLQYQNDQEKEQFSISGYLNLTKEVPLREESNSTNDFSDSSSCELSINERTGFVLQSLSKIKMEEGEIGEPISYLKCLTESQSGAYAYDCLGRLLFERTDQRVRQYFWMKDRLFFVEEVDGATGERCTTQYLDLVEKKAILTMTDSDKGVLLVDDGFTFDFKTKEIVHTKDALEENGWSLDINRKFQLENRRAAPDEYLSESVRNHWLVLNQEQVKAKVSAFIQKLGV